jgi:hypothetical protein
VALFVHFLYKNDHFTKTGSGQTHRESTQKSAVFLQLLVVSGTILHSAWHNRNAQSRKGFLLQFMAQVRNVTIDCG